MITTLKIDAIEDRHFLAALGLSLLLHLALLLGARHQPDKPLEQIAVELRELGPAQRSRQIVSHTDAPEAEPAPGHAFLGERNARTEHEQIRRGQEVKQSSPPKPPATVKPSSRKPAPASKISSFHLSQKDLEDSFKAQDAKTNSREKSDAQREAELKTQEPFSKNSFKEVFLPRSGSPDFLPDIPDGDITLLNTKADRFAVFVSRVANQVFGNLRKLNWQELPASEVARIRGFAKVHAVMTPEGKLLSLALEESSGNSYFDRVLKAAVQKGAWDQNPPQAALGKDGNIHFVFQARSWVRGARNRMFEQRWILLGTGLL